MKSLAIERMNAEKQPEFYVSRITKDGYVRKNKLEEAIEAEVQKFNRWIIPAARLNEFTDEIKKRVDHLNTTHPRCKPIHLGVWLPGRSINEGISRHDIQCDFNINLQLELFATWGFAVNQEGIKVYKF